MYSNKNQNSQIYRLAQKITEIKDPEIYENLLKHIIKNASSKQKIKQLIKIVDDGDSDVVK